MDRNKIFKLIQTMVEQKSFMSGQIAPEHKIPNLYPIESVYQGYACERQVIFKPHQNYSDKVEICRDNLDDDKIRFKVLAEYNNKIDKYNKWLKEEQEELDYKMFHLPHFPMWSFVAIRKLPKQRTTWDNIISTTFHINDEELYKLNMEDPDFLIKINKTISEYIYAEIRQGMERNISADRSIWYEPNIRFVTWLQTNPSDAKPYPIKPINKLEQKKFEVFNTIKEAFELEKIDQSTGQPYELKNLYTELGQKYSKSYTTIRDWWYEMCKKQNYKSPKNK